MHDVKIYSDKGILIESIPLSINIAPADVYRRVWIGDNGLEYKGAGITYTHHNVRKVSDSQILLSKNDVVYGGYAVKDTRYEGLVGIICTKFQPYFRDYIGGCGPKEYKILKNSVEFKYSGVKVVDYISLLDDHNIYVCDYKAKGSLASSTPSPKDILNILEYIISTDWCCPWDKNTYRDLDGLGYLRDPADWFLSNSFNDKLGTVYSILYNMFLKDSRNYEELVRLSGLINIPLTLFTLPYICLLLMHKFGYNIPHHLRDRYDQKLYQRIIADHLFLATYCCQLDSSDEYYSRENVRKMMLENLYQERRSV